MNIRFNKFFLLLLVFIVSVISLKAQSTSSLLSGKVLDEKNSPVKNVNVQITFVPWNKTRRTTTDKKGFFCAANLPPGGPYAIKFSCEGYEDQTREILSLDLGNINNLSLHMRLAKNEKKETGIAGIQLVSNESSNGKNSE